MGAAVRSVPRPRIPSPLRWPVLKRRLLVAGALAALLFAGYHFWLRNLSLVAIEEVTIRGAGQNGTAEAALREAALDHFIFLSETQIRRVCREFVEYYNRTRPSQAIGAIPDPYPELQVSPPT